MSVLVDTIHRQYGDVLMTVSWLRTQLKLDSFVNVCDGIERVTALLRRDNQRRLFTVWVTAG